MIARPSRARLDELRRTLPGASWQEQQRWCDDFESMAQAWREDGFDPPFALGTLALQLGRYRTALALYERSRSEHGEHASTSFNRAIAHWQLGEHAEADTEFASATRRSGARVDRLSAIAAAREEMDSHRRRCAELPGIAGAPLSLQALGKVHAERLAFHHRHAGVAEAANIPAFANQDDAQLWIAKQCGGGDKMSFAVLHDEWGAVGSAGLSRRGESALVDYWLGADVHGRGLGTTLIGLLKTLATAHGIERLFAMVFDSNVRSQRVLLRHGFSFMDAAPFAALLGRGRAILHAELGPAAAAPPPPRLAETLLRLMTELKIDFDTSTAAPSPPRTEPNQ